MVEVNGPANIVMEINNWRWDGTKTDVENIQRLGKVFYGLKRTALRTIRYMKAHDKDPEIMWHDIPEPKS